MSNLNYRRQPTLIAVAFFDLRGGVIDSLGAPQSLLLGGLLYPPVLFWVDLALRPRTRKYIDVVNLDARRLVLDGLPRDGD